MTGKKVGEPVGDVNLGLMVGVAGGEKKGVVAAVTTLVGRGIKDLCDEKFVCSIS